ncbi:hypothetical protein MD484_g2089, partial [Candolleomyces efflorescens]
MSECEIFCLPCVLVAACFAVCNCQGAVGSGNCCTGCGFCSRGCGKCCGNWGGHDPALDRYTAEVERDMIADRERREREHAAGYGTGPSMPVPQAHNPTDRRERGEKHHDVEQWKRGVEEKQEGSGPSPKHSTHRSRQLRSQEFEYPPNTYSGDRRSHHDERRGDEISGRHDAADLKSPRSDESRSHENHVGGSSRELPNPYDGLKGPESQESSAF